MIATNKRLLIFKSCNDSNRCTLCRGKLDQHATRFSRSVHVWSRTIHISRCPHIATLRETLIDLAGSHCSWEKDSRHNPQHTGWPTRGSVPILSRANQWSSRRKPNSCRWPTTRLTGPINTSMNKSEFKRFRRHSNIYKLWPIRKVPSLSLKNWNKIWFWRYRRDEQLSP
jgi:hypothetical protein